MQTLTPPEWLEDALITNPSPAPSAPVEEQLTAFGGSAAMKFELPQIAENQQRPFCAYVSSLPMP